MEGVQDEKFLQTYILSDLSSLSILNLSIINSQEAFTDRINQFLEDVSMKLLILVVNMLESSPEAVNHLRMIIEQCHPSSPEASKSILLLLHFPSSMFFNGIYPTLFLHGWKYRYIDSLSSEAEPGLIDVKVWVNKCLDRNVPQSEVEDESLSKSLLDSVESAIPLLMADFKSNKYINKTEMNVVLSHKVAKLICDRFLEYFGIHLYTKYLEDVAKATYQRKSTINMKTQIEEKIKDNFFYFIKYILSFFHIHGGTSALMNQKCSDKLHEFIHALIPHTPVPDLVKLADEVSHFPQATLEGKCSYQLPFFLYAFEEIESFIESGVRSAANEAERKDNIKRGEIFLSVIAILKERMQV